ncbi:putative acetyltransferase [Lacrimispora xylanisolvens]|uniref:Putative acetyltransferase n=1 Tax=Lacrimispora xylanisolvens TaxID=384636 RepID=A0A2S6HNG1_9FIRM|nr:N-acetyltransferase [Hungatella xylanolytica]MBE5989374.1 N-acetyltransferase [Paenibacillaceae bacterium]PPK79038.1 putative acetyltransferase [Hungatella xylanolytica]
MVRDFQAEDLNRIMELWLETNIQAHDFIKKNYWQDHFDEVMEILPKASVYVYEDNGSIEGFIGLMNNYIAGIFISKDNQSRGIGRQLLHHVKENHNELSLKVYEKNQRAVNFYLREGFLVTEKQVDRENGEVEYEMVWNRT